METFIDSRDYRAFLTDGKYRPLVHPMKEDIVGDVREPLWILLGTVGIVLLIACANVANLCLFAPRARQREIAVRLALGSGRAALVRALLTEALVLAAIGALAGVALAALALPVFVRLAPSSIPRLDEVRHRRRGPVRRCGVGRRVGDHSSVSCRRCATRGRRCSARFVTAAAAPPIIRRANAAAIVLVAAQTALAMVLLVGSGLLARSFSTDACTPTSACDVRDVADRAARVACRRPMPKARTSIASPAVSSRV